MYDGYCIPRTSRATRRTRGYRMFGDDLPQTRGPYRSYTVPMERGHLHGFYFRARQSTGESYEILYLHREPRSSSRYLYSRYSGVVQLKYRSAVVLRPKNFVAILLFIVDKYSSFLENTIVRIVVNTREENLLEDLKR